MTCLSMKKMMNFLFVFKKTNFKNDYVFNVAFSSMLLQYDRRRHIIYTLLVTVSFALMSSEWLKFDTDDHNCVTVKPH